jgi:hypothetical protein
MVMLEEFGPFEEINVSESDDLCPSLVRFLHFEVLT